MLIFGAIYRPTREVSTLETAPYYAREVRYQAEVEPTFERFVYRPLTRGVLRLADAHAGHPGGEPPRLPRLRDGAGPLPRPAAVVAGMSGPGLPARARLPRRRRRARARPAPPPRRVPLGGLPGLGWRVACHLRPRRFGARQRRAVRGVLFANPAAGVTVGYAVDPLSAWFLRDVRRARGADRRLQHRLPGPRDPARSDGVRRRGLQPAPGGGRDGVRGRRRARLPGGLGADEPRHRRARRDRSREPAEPPLRLPLPRHVPPRHGLPRRRLLPARLAARAPSPSPTCLGAAAAAARGAGCCSSSSWSASA